MKHYMNEYTDALDELQLSCEQQDRLFRAAVHQAEQHTKHRPKQRTAIAGILLASVLALTACGVVIKTISELYAPYFGGSDSQSAIIEEYGTALDASDTDNGVTVSAKAVLGDAYHAWILYTISWEDDVNFNLPGELPQTPAEYSTEKQDFFLCLGETNESITPSPYSKEVQFIDPDPTDNEIELMECYTFESAVPFSSVSKTFDTLYWYDSNSSYAEQATWLSLQDVDPSVLHTAAEGHWELNFEANYENCAVSVPLEDNATFTYKGRTCNITKLELSPLSVFVEYTYTRTQDDPPIAEDASGTYDSVWEDFGRLSHSLSITTTSDRTYHTNGFTPEGDQYIKSTNSYRFIVGGTFTELIPPDEMKSITIGDTTFDIPRE